MYSKKLRTHVANNNGRGIPTKIDDVVQIQLLNIESESLISALNLGIRHIRI